MGSSTKIRCTVVLALLIAQARISQAMDCMSESNGLKDQAAMNGINFGVAAQASSLSGEFKNLVEREFNMIVAENDMKMDFMYTASSTPGQGTYKWSSADEIVSFAKANNMKVRGHTLLWHNAIPSGLRSWSMSQDEWRTWVTDYITTVVKRYKGEIVEWDVVNEVYVHNSIDGESGPNGMRDSFWLQKLGPDYVELCFKAAHAADPAARLYYNDYAAEWSNPKTDIIYEKLVDMKKNNIPVHGMGFQGHISYYDDNVQRYRTNFQAFTDAGFEISLTEVDIFQACMDSNGYFEKQAEIYGEFIKMAIELKFVNFLVWGLHDGVSWVNDHQNLFPCKGNPLLYDGAMDPKPAYFTVKQTMCDLVDGETGRPDSVDEPSGEDGSNDVSDASEEGQQTDVSENNDGSPSPVPTPAPQGSDDGQESDVPENTEDPGVSEGGSPSPVPTEAPEKSDAADSDDNESEETDVPESTEDPGINSRLSPSPVPTPAPEDSDGSADTDESDDSGLKDPTPTASGPGRNNSRRRKIQAIDFDSKHGGTAFGKGGWILFSFRNYVETVVENLDGHRKIVVKAGAEFGGDSYPEINIFVDGKLVRTRKVKRSPQRIGVVLDAPLSGDHTLKISYTNDDFGANERNLIVMHTIVK